MICLDCINLSIDQLVCKTLLLIEMFMRRCVSFKLHNYTGL